MGIADQAAGAVGGEGGTMLRAGPVLREAEKLAGEALSAKSGDDVEAFHVADLYVRQRREIGADGELHHGDGVTVVFGEEDGFRFVGGSGKEGGDLRAVVGGAVGPVCGAETFPGRGVGGGDGADVNASHSFYVISNR